MSTESDNLYRALISVKGVLRQEDRFALLKNRRGEWELPGGKLEVGERFNECLVREFREELGIAVVCGRLLDVVPHHFYDNIVVIIYSCDAETTELPTLSEEHTDFGWFLAGETKNLNVPHSYRQAILATARDEG